METIKNNSLLEKIYKNSPEGIFICDNDGKIIDFNEAFCEKIGLHKDQIRNKEIREFILDTELPKLKAVWRNIIISGKWKGNIYIKGADRIIGSAFIRSLKEGSNIICFTKDLTANEITLNKYIDINKRLELATNAGRIGIWEWDLKDKIIINKVMKELFEIDEDGLEFDPSILRDKMILEDLEQHKKLIKKIISEKKGLSSIFRIKSSEGIRHIRSVSDLQIEQNKIKKIFGINIDISDQIRNEELIINAKQNAELSESLKTAFLQNISHELRTPLNGIIGFSNLLQEDGLSDEEKNEYAGLIKTSSNRLIDTINNIIDISKLETGQFKPKLIAFSARSLVEDIFTLHRNKFLNSDISFNYACDDDINIMSDQTVVSKIFNHLLSNAIKFTNKGKIEIGYELLDGICRFFVKDTGIGIQETKKDYIFRRFVQGENEINRSYEGSGLGLAISKELLDIIGGNIFFDSVLGKGTNFYFDIPIQVSNDTKKLNNMKTTKNLKVLIVEDDDASFTLLRILLSKMNFEIERAKNGLEAVEMVKNNTDYDLILMDMKMPRMNGYDATREIRKFNKEIGIIAATADALDVDRERALSVGCDDHLAKPIDTNDLKAAINKIIN
jgi:PAS domain S-box-containing protein